MTVNVALAFPSLRAAWLPAAEETLPLPLRWREAENGDLPFLRQLYADTRAAELAAVPWPQVMRQQFLDSQFALQHLHFTTHYQPAHYLLVEHAGAPIGRLYLHNDGHEATVIDIALTRAMRGNGIGSHLLRLVQRIARRDGLAAVVLHVDKRNVAAQRLYQRLHFTTETDIGSHLQMRWPTA